MQCLNKCSVSSGQNPLCTELFWIWQTNNETPWSQRWPHITDELNQNHPKYFRCWNLIRGGGHTNQGQNKDKHFFSPQRDHIFFPSLSLNRNQGLSKSFGLHGIVERLHISICQAETYYLSNILVLVRAHTPGAPPHFQIPEPCFSRFPWKLCWILVAF